MPQTPTIEKINPNIILDNIENGGLPISGSIVKSSFNPEEHHIEYFVYNKSKQLINSEYLFSDWSILKNSNPKNNVSTDTISLNPIDNLNILGFKSGEFYSIYNFVNYNLLSSPLNPYYIKDISSDRTEINISTNKPYSELLQQKYNYLKSEIDSNPEFTFFYISGFNNINIKATNIEVINENNSFYFSIKLLTPLNNTLDINSKIYIFTKVADSLAYRAELPSNVVEIDNIQSIQGPNTNINIKELNNPSGIYMTEEDLMQSTSDDSKDNLQNYLNQKGVKITPNYSYDTFDEFVNFSSAKQRILNFIEKVKEIQEYQIDLETLNTLSTGSTTLTNIKELKLQIQNIIKGFDGYEYYLYYNNSEYSYPKTGSSFPYELLPTDSTTVLNWLGDDQENSQYYGGIISSASIYDENNPNWLYYTIPEYIREEPENSPYIQFCNMVGQHFDELWLYTKALTSKLNTTNELDKGVPLKLAEETIRSLGYKGFGSNYNTQDNYIGLTGEDNKNYTPPTGSELITDYIAINEGNITNYWNPEYSYLFYVESFISQGFPYAIDRVSKEIFKRLYHNMVYLIKKKGTIAGLRHLINIWGIPDTIIRINESGKGDTHYNGIDHWENNYNYAYHPVGPQNIAGSSLEIPWMPLNQNYKSESKYIVPDTIMFRFKTTGYPSSSIAGDFYTQSLLVKKSDSNPNSQQFDFGISLEYIEPNNPTYSGSNPLDNRNLGNLKLYISGSDIDGGTISSNPITLPFYNKEWWSVMLKRNKHVETDDNSIPVTYSLFVKSKTNQPQSNHKLSYEGSASLEDNILISVNESWNKFNVSPNNGIYLGGHKSGSHVGDIILTDPNKIFSGSLQEFRYYSQPIPENIFNSYVLNPKSIQGINPLGGLNSSNILSFRAPLGSELDNKFKSTSTNSYIQSLQSIHPLVYSDLSSSIVESFINPSDNSVTSSYNITYYDNVSLKTFSKPNVEYYYIPQFYVGSKSPINNKINIESGSFYGYTLSPYNSLIQNYSKDKRHSTPNNKLEVSFSPQSEINEDISSTFGNVDLFKDLGDPKKSIPIDNKYFFLHQISENYFGKYSKKNPYDYIRLIKYFDNSLFKAIKNYVPARTNLSTGIVIKQHVLERNKLKTNPPNLNTTLAKGNWGIPLIYQNIELQTEFTIGIIEGGTGGVLGTYNYILPNTFGQYYISQSWIEHIESTVGLLDKKQDTQKEFYDGEFSGSEFHPINPHVFEQYPISFPNTTYDVNINTGSLHNLTTQNFNVAIYDGDRIDDLETFIENVNPSLGTQVVVVTSRSTNTSRFISAVAIFHSDGESVVNGWEGWNELSEEYLGDYPTGSFVYGEVLANEGFPRPSFFQFELPSPDTGSIASGGDDYVGGLPYNTIVSSGLNVFKSDYNSTRTDGPSGTTDAGFIRPRRWWIFKNEIETRNKTLEGSSGFNWLHGGEYTSSPSSFIFLSPLRTQNNNINSLPNTGGMNLTMQPVLFYTNNTPFYEYYPLIINIHSIDLNGNDNINTLLNDPDYQISLDSTPSPPYNDSYGLGGNVIKRNLLNESLYWYDYPNNTHFYIFQGDSRHNQTLLDTTNVYFNFSPLLPSDVSIENSDFNPLLNNYNSNRLNSKIMDVDYFTGITTPNNLVSILNNKAQKAQLPDSNYSSLRIITPRYLGSEVKSLTYNFYTPSGKVQPPKSLFTTASFFSKKSVASNFLNGDTGSWGGDVSYGKTSIIDKNPLYIAHFTNHQKEYNVWGTDKYELDKLIFISDEEIDTQGKEDYEPITLELGRTNEYIYDVVNNFERKRRVDVLFDDSLRFKSKPKFLTFDIIDPATEYITLGSNQINDTSLSPSWSFTRFETERYLITQSFTSNQRVRKEDIPALLYTGSYSLILSGSLMDVVEFSKSIFEEETVSGSMGLGGPFLAVIHTYNQVLANNYYHTGSSAFVNSNPFNPTALLGVTENLDANINENYISWDSIESKLGIYDSTEEPFLLNVGDTIRVTYNTSGSINASSKFIIQDFVITEVPTIGMDPNDPDNHFTFRYNGTTRNIGTTGFVNLFNEIKVHPNPSELENPIPEGKIHSFTIRRRNFVDNSIIIDSKNFKINQEERSFKGGFLIPKDLSKNQRNNVLNVINALKSKNAFTKN